MDERIRYIKRALDNSRGDDLFRAQLAFSGCTSQEMDSQYGQSGRTRRQMIQEYEDHEARWLAADGLLKERFPELG